MNPFFCVPGGQEEDQQLQAESFIGPAVIVLMAIAISSAIKFCDKAVLVAIRARVKTTASKVRRMSTSTPLRGAQKEDKRVDESATQAETFVLSTPSSASLQTPDQV